jgi:hypothetical protein
MSQNSLIVANGTGAAVRAALNNAFDTLGTNNSGAAAPSTTQAYLLWADTTTGLLKIRNAANGAWIVIGLLAGIGLGRIFNSVSTQTGAYTVVAADQGKVIHATANTWELALTAVATLGDGFCFALVNSGAGTITINPNGAETIDGVATLTIAAGQSVVLYCTGSVWRILSYWPGYGTSGQVLTSGGSGVMPSMGTPASVEAYSSVNLAVSTATETDLAWDSETHDTDAAHTTGGSNTRLTVPVGKGGRWLVYWHIRWQGNATGLRRVTLRKNGADNYISVETPGNTGVASMSSSRVVSLAAADYVECRAYQDSGGNLNVEGGIDASFFGMVYLGV